VRTDRAFLAVQFRDNACQTDSRTVLLTIHKEFVSAKIAGEVASLDDPALDRILDF